MLGFAKPALHHLETIANPDYVLRLLGLWARQSVIISRFTQDLYIWCTNEFNYLKLDSTISGISSMMPQKQNPFLIERIKGKAGSVLGANFTALTTIKNTPFGNSLDVNQESLRYLETAFTEMKSIYVLLKLVLFHSKFNTEKMKNDAISNFCTMTDFSEALVMSCGLDYRTAYKIVSDFVRYIKMQNKEFIKISQMDLEIFLDGKNINCENIVDIFKGVFNPTYGVNMRKSAGGPNCNVLIQRIDQHKCVINSYRNWIENEKIRLQESHVKIMGAME